jgi:hypothetical protein
MFREEHRWKMFWNKDRRRENLRGRTKNNRMA